MQYSIQKWIRIALFNLTLIAFIGFVLRYKIAFSLPFVDQKHLLQAHSHFAFSGWISHVLMALMVSFLAEKGLEKAFKKYHWILVLNLVSAYGMLLCFPFQGYGLYSITFSTLSILTAYLFAVLYWKDLKRYRISETAGLWFKAALFFNALSSLGAFALSFMMANKIIHQNWYLAAIYFFLHFQYNGWFFFACGGLWFAKLRKMNVYFTNEKLIFALFAFACIPTYFLCTLWMKMSTGVYFLIVLSAILQVIALYYIVHEVKRNLSQLKSNFFKISNNLFALSLVAFSIKIVLQLLSTIPSLNQMAYGFRPIVIGYLHLVLLGFITLFILAYASATHVIQYNSRMVNGAIIFAGGIIINEILLMFQGTAALELISIPLNNEMLLGAAFILFSGALLLFLSQKKEQATSLN